MVRCNNPEDFHRFSFRNLRIPAQQYTMVSARVRIDTHDSAGFHDDLFGRAIDSEARMGSISVLPVVNVNESFAVDQAGKPSDLIRVLLLKREGFHTVMPSKGS